jgi:hypothetical protein
VHELSLLLVRERLVAAAESEDNDWNAQGRANLANAAVEIRLLNTEHERMPAGQIERFRDALANDCAYSEALGFTQLSVPPKRWCESPSVRAREERLLRHNVQAQATVTPCGIAEAHRRPQPLRPSYPMLGRRSVLAMRLRIDAQRSQIGAYPV